jgi:imidazolonepropionase-like amidohydrolase
VKRLILSCLLAITTSAAAQDVAVRGDTVWTMAGPPIENGVVVIRDGKIVAVGAAANVAVPGGATILSAKVVTPGLIDAHSVVGLAGQYNYDHDQDQLERSAPIQPQLRAIDAYNADERLVKWIRSFGVTTIHTGHAPGEIVSGQTMIVKTTGNTVEDAVVVPAAALAVTLGDEALKTGKESPGTRSKVVSLLRQKLIAAREYRDERSRPDDGGGDDDEPAKRDLELEVLARVIDGELPLLVTAHRSQDIASALRLKEEFGFRLWLDGASESYRLADRIAAAGVPVIIHPTMMRAWNETENMSFETASKLVERGIPVAIQSGYEDYVPKTRIVLYEAAWAAANGLGFEPALAAITIDAARILGIDGRVGSLAPGMDGDVALYDGDPFEYTTHCVGVIIDGEVVSREVR